MSSRPFSTLVLGAVILGALAGAAPVPAAAQTNPVVVLETSAGNIHIELFSDRAPITVRNFLELLDEGFYDQLLFHRVVRDFAVQTGLVGLDGQLRGEDRETIENESDNRLRNFRGTVAMARLDRPHTATTEFFINVRDNPSLNFRAYNRDGWGYTVFGEVIEGMDVVDQIAELPTTRVGPFRDFPNPPIALYQAYRRP